MSITTIHGLPTLDPISPDSDKVKKDNALSYVRGYFSPETINEEIIEWCKRCENYWYEERNIESLHSIDTQNLYITHYQTLISIFERSQPS